MKTYRETEESAYNYCKQQYKFIYGYFKDKPSYSACFLTAVYIACVLRLITSAITGYPTSQEVSTQFIFVGMMTLFVYATIVYYRKEIMLLAKACDRLPILDVPWDVKSSFKSIQILIDNSFERKYCLVHNFMFYSVGILFCIRPVLISVVFGTEIDLVLTGSSSDTYEHAFFFILDAIAVLSTALTCVTTLNIFSCLIFTLRAHYKLIEKAVMSPTKSNHKERFVKQCVMHLDSLLTIFEGVQYIFQRVLFVVYVGMFLCTAVTREIFLRGVDFSVVFLLLLCTVDETIYLSPFCVVMESFIEVGKDLSFALYSSKWLSYNINVRRSYYLTMIRLSKSPNISIYYGGPSITLRSYLAVINGTFSFLMSALLIYLS